MSGCDPSSELLVICTSSDKSYQEHYSGIHKMSTQPDSQSYQSPLVQAMVRFDAVLPELRREWNNDGHRHFGYLMSTVGLSIASVALIASALGSLHANKGAVVGLILVGSGLEFLFSRADRTLVRWIGLMNERMRTSTIVYNKLLSHVQAIDSRLAGWGPIQDPDLLAVDEMVSSCLAKSVLVWALYFILFICLCPFG